MMQLQPDKSVADVCTFGDEVIEKLCSNIFKSKKIEKGIAFPTCVSVNECVSHYSPLPAESTSLKAGDVVKMYARPAPAAGSGRSPWRPGPARSDLGCHIDGYVAVAGHTVVLPNEAGEKPTVEGPLADVMRASEVASEVVQKMLKPGVKNTEVTKAVLKVAEDFGVTPVLGVHSHRMKRFILEGNEVIPMFKDPETRTEEFEFQLNEVYGVDIMFTTGDGKAREHDARTTVFKRAVDQNYRLKMKASRYVLTEVNKRFPTMPFCLRALSDQKAARMGVLECVKHELLQPYPVMYEREGTHTSHIKFTALLLPSGTTRATGFPIEEGRFVSEKTPSEETAAILATSAKRKKKKKKNKQQKAAGAAE